MSRFHAFCFIGALSLGSTALPVQHEAAAAEAGITMDICPNTYQSFPKDSPPLTCPCSADAVKGGTVYGANPYLWMSGICRAALQAGAVGPNGGSVVVTPAPGTKLFPSITRNGVHSSPYGGGDGFVVAAAPGSAAASGQSAPMTVSETGIKMDICPDSYQGFPKDAPPLSCTCSPEAVKGGTIYGANPYLWMSGICRAALQAGAVGPQGGAVVVTSAPEAKVFPSITRNGVYSSSYGGGNGFVVAAAPGSPAAHPASEVVPAPAAPSTPQVDARGQPVQAPIAATLKAAGHVQVYINFVTDSAALLPTSNMVLAELLAALRQAPALKVELVGHTDSDGTSAHNQELSERRAAAVYLWLVQHGIARERMHASGRGFLEPIASNDTVIGKALNRRVEVKAVN